MPNRRRGDVSVTLDGRAYRLRLTLGALAELEDLLRLPDLAALPERFAAGRPRSRDLLALLAVALRGGGAALTDEEVAGLPLDDLEEVARALADLLVLTFGSAEEASPANPPPPQGA